MIEIFLLSANSLNMQINDSLALTNHANKIIVVLNILVIHQMHIKLPN